MNVCTTKITSAINATALNAFTHFFIAPLAAHRISTTKNHGITANDNPTSVKCMEFKINVQTVYRITTHNFAPG